VLRDKRIVITGVWDADSVAYATAERALLAGAFVTLVAPAEEFARCRALADALPFGAHAVRADLTDAADVARLREHLSCGYRAVDGALHAGGAAPPEALAHAVAPLLAPGDRSLVERVGADAPCVALGSDAGTILQLADRRTADRRRSAALGPSLRGIATAPVALHPAAVPSIPQPTALPPDGVQEDEAARSSCHGPGAPPARHPDAGAAARPRAMSAASAASPAPEPSARVRVLVADARRR